MTKSFAQHSIAWHCNEPQSGSRERRQHNLRLTIETCQWKHFCCSPRPNKHAVADLEMMLCADIRAMDQNMSKR
jgi:hypothetical protein